MAATRKSTLPQIFELPLLVAAVLIGAFYFFVTQPAMKDGWLHRYTTEHSVEYVIVSFFIWGLTDVAFRICTFPREMLALRHDWLSRRNGREDVSRAATLLAQLQKQPQWLQQSRIGRRLIQALVHLQEKGSADEFADYLRSLADHDFERTQTNYSLVRFICWVTPMFGFLGTVVHFGTALSGQTAGDISDKLPTVVAEMGTAFNTTTVALTAATTMMFALFLCERTERGIIHAIDLRTEHELLNRFEITDASLTPFLSALHAATQASLQTMQATVESQLRIWSDALQIQQRQAEQEHQWQAQVWMESLQKLEQRFEVNDAERETRLQRLLKALEEYRQGHDSQVQATVEQVSSLKGDFTRLVNTLDGLARDDGELVKLQVTLTDNLRVLGETQQIDQALHGLTAAIHLLTARGNSTAPRDDRRAA